MVNKQTTPRTAFTDLLLRNLPDAVAWIQGNTETSALSGMVNFYHTIYGGVLVEAQIFGLPNLEIPGSSNFYAMHIHETGDCSDNFEHTGGHYNPGETLHPDHVGDMPPLLGSQGYAYSVFYDKRFIIPEIIGKAVIIHKGTDDFTSQPAGNAGEKIGCGVIKWAV